MHETAPLNAAGYLRKRADQIIRTEIRLSATAALQASLALQDEAVNTLHANWTEAGPRTAERAVITGPHVEQPVPNTKGMIEVAAFAANEPLIPPKAAITVIGRCRQGGQSLDIVAGPAVLNFHVAALDEPTSRRLWRNARNRSANTSGDPTLEYPITGNAGYCARAAGANAAAPPSSDGNPFVSLDHLFCGGQRRFRNGQAKSRIEDQPIAVGIRCWA